MTKQLFKLLAIVAVDPVRRVRCQQPHCGHSVYARIHVVEEAGQLLVLGSDCFAKRYGEGHTSGFRGYGAGGGRVLTEAERELLLNNTAALLEQFEAERQRKLELAEAKLSALRKQFAAQPKRYGPLHVRKPDLQHQSRTNTEPSIIEALPMWASLKKPNSSFFAYGVGNGQCWVVMQSATHAGCFIAPSPTPFESWDEALPQTIGNVDVERRIYVSQKGINALVSWFMARCTNGSRIDSSAAAIQRFALGICK